MNAQLTKYLINKCMRISCQFTIEVLLPLPLSVQKFCKVKYFLFKDFSSDYDCISCR